MADEKRVSQAKEAPKPFWTTDKTTLFAPKGAKHYKPGQEVSVHPRQKEKFVAFGFAETKEEALQNDAHAAIAEKAPTKKPVAGKSAEPVIPNPDDKK